MRNMRNIRVPATVRAGVSHRLTLDCQVQKDRSVSSAIGLGTSVIDGLRTTRPRHLVFIAAALLAGLHAALAAPVGEVERDGPWAFTERFNESKQRLEQMAVTPAVEDSNIWLLLACTQSRFTASLMNNAQFPYDVGARLALGLRTNGFPVVSVTADSIQKNQLSIDPATSRHLMPLFLNGQTLAVTVGVGNMTHDYTFTLQPNGRSLERIMRECWRDE
jgi:hypothetical protein